MTTTTKHYSEAELLETYYMKPDQFAPVMMHLRTCEPCIARYNRHCPKRDELQLSLLPHESYGLDFQTARLAMSRHLHGTLKNLQKPLSFRFYETIAFPRNSHSQKSKQVDSDLFSRTG